MRPSALCHLVYLLLTLSVLLNKIIQHLIAYPPTARAIAHVRQVRIIVRRTRQRLLL